MATPSSALPAHAPTISSAPRPAMAIGTTSRTFTPLTSVWMDSRPSARRAAMKAALNKLTSVHAADPATAIATIGAALKNDP
jgi:hypothetical protein